jgi:hypothetical protein
MLNVTIFLDIARTLYIVHNITPSIHISSLGPIQAPCKGGQYLLDEKTETPFAWRISPERHVTDSDVGDYFNDMAGDHNTCVPRNTTHTLYKTVYCTDPTCEISHYGVSFV